MLPKLLTTLFLSLLLAFTGFSQNLLTNGDFENGSTDWSYWADDNNGYQAHFQITNTEVYSGTSSGEMQVTALGAAQDVYKIMVKNDNFSLVAGTSYHVSFYLKCNVANTPFVLHLHEDSSPYTTYYLDNLTAGTTWQQYSFDFTATETTSNVRWALKLGQAVANFYFDEVSIEENTQVYDNLIDPANSIDWSHAGVPEGIPDVPTALDVSNFGAVGDGTTDNLNAFQNALSQANAGEAVFIPSGDYRINGPLTIPEGVVLRGECPSNTTIDFNLNGQAANCISVVTYQYGTFVDVTSSVNKGITSLTVADPSNFVVGSYAELQQENDPALMYTDPAFNQSWAENSMGQIFIVLAVNGNDIVLDRPLYLNYNPSLNPQLRPIGLTEGVGIENLTINRLDAGDGHTISLKNAANCWVRNIESNMTYRAHVHMDRVIDSEVRDSYFHHSHDYGGGGHGYGVNLGFHVTATLVENNIFEHLRHSMMTQLGATGNVFGYNYSFDTFWDNPTNIAPDISMHGHYPTMNLFEGNIVQEATFSDYWGPVGPGNTMYRNRVEASEILVADHSHYQNVIANELNDGSSLVLVESSVNNTFQHSNNANGTTTNTTTASLLPSLYLNAAPDFFGTLPFPAIGPEFALGSQSIPAKERHLAGQSISACDTCADGVQNGDETGLDCGGSLCADCPIYGCTATNAHNYDPLATTDDDSCDTCSDGIQNGDETGLDCGGSLCAACNTGCSNLVLDATNFENGWGIWNDGGSDARRSNKDAAFANSGSYCVRLRDNTTTSTMTTDALDLSTYEEITIAYSFITNSMENNEDFFVEINTGSGYTTIANYASGSDFINDTPYNKVEVLEGPFSSTTTLRFRCDASGNGDKVYIDDVTIAGCINSFASSTPAPIEKIRQQAPTLIAQPTAIKLYPNPTRTQLNVSMELLEEDAQLLVFDMTGKMLTMQTLNAGTSETRVDTRTFVPGCYFVSLVRRNGNRTTEKFIVIR